MADISQIEIPSGEVFDIKDTTAREDISKIKDSIAGSVHFRGVTSSELHDGSTRNPIVINGELYKASRGDFVFNKAKEYIWDESKWNEFGDLTGLKSLAYKDEASASYTPEGTLSRQTFSGNLMTLTGRHKPYGKISSSIFSGKKETLEFSGAAERRVSIDYTPEGTISKPQVDVQVNTEKVRPVSSVGTLPSLNAKVVDDTLELEFSAGSLPEMGNAIDVATGIKNTTISDITFTGTKKDISGRLEGDTVSYKCEYTPEGTISGTTFNGFETDVILKGTPTGQISIAEFSGKQKEIVVS